ncbi:MAG: tRNA (guanosine(46)-N7)-methyltransferase TrmB [Ruminococcus sp.]|nr:tRNA (guanosine(46)-N7)-methyltransferase TrmB [Ruminococcus sp.]
MRIRKKKWAAPELSVCDFFVKNPEEHAGKWCEAFPNKQPVYLEIGCGKGGFAGQFALQNPHINLIAVDIKIDMLGVGRRTIVKLFEENGKSQEEISNLLLVNYNVEQLDRIITPDDKIERLFINFCNPWPRERHKKRRLTYPRKLEMYKRFLAKDAEIRFKTDDDGLFEESVTYFKDCGYDITFLTRDLHQSGFEGNIITEHEKMFTEEGKTIKFLIAKQKR